MRTHDACVWCNNNEANHPPEQDPFVPEEIWEVEAGLTLCDDCYKERKMDV